MSCRWLLLLGSLVTLSGLGAQRPDSSFALTALDGKVRRITIAELRALPQQELKLAETDGSPMVVRGPALRAVLTLGGAPTGQMLRGPNLTIGVLAEGVDGYKVLFSLAELDDQFGSRLAIVALSQNGRELPLGDGPLRIVMGQEEKRARWVRALTALRFIRIE